MYFFCFANKLLFIINYHHMTHHVGGRSMRGGWWLWFLIVACDFSLLTWFGSRRLVMTLVLLRLSRDVREPNSASNTTESKLWYRPFYNSLPSFSAHTNHETVGNCETGCIRIITFKTLQFVQEYSWFHENASFSVHFFNEHYLSSS